MAKSKESVVLTRREALLLSTAVGLGAVLTALASNSNSVEQEFD